jgi:uncharacterized membrane protein required for colicin V production
VGGGGVEDVIIEIVFVLIGELGVRLRGVVGGNADVVGVIVGLGAAAEYLIQINPHLHATDIYLL